MEGVCSCYTGLSPYKCFPGASVEKICLHMQEMNVQSLV